MKDPLRLSSLFYMIGNIILTAKRNYYVRTFVIEIFIIMELRNNFIVMPSSKNNMVDKRD